MEEWKDIPGYEGSYQVSNLGRVKSLAKVIYNGYVEYLSNEKIMTHNIGNVGYPRVTLRKEGKGKQFCVHTLVVNAFLNKAENGQHINHIDGNKLNPILSNLEVISCRENITHALLRRSKSSKHHGVVFIRRKNRRDKWRASIWLKKNVTVGFFDTEEEAHQAYLRALVEYGIENKYANVA